MLALRAKEVSGRDAQAWEAVLRPRIFSRLGSDDKQVEQKTSLTAPSMPWGYSLATVRERAVRQAGLT
jgi:hypothetical protein